MSNDELQRAIDDITSGGGMSSPVSPVMQNNTNDNDMLADEMMPTELPQIQKAATAQAEEAIMPEVKPVEEQPIAQPVEESATQPVETAVFQMPEMPVAPAETEPVMPVASEPKEEEIVEPEEEVKTEAEPEVAAEVAPAIEPDLEEIRKNALKELYPMLKDMNINPEQAFDICMQVAEDGEKNAIKEAFEAAKKISDNGKRADALLKVVEIIEK